MINYRIARYFRGTKISRFSQIFACPRKTEFCTITYVCKMALLKYFKPINRSTLPLPSGPLSEIVPSSSIKAANKEVESIFFHENDPEENSATAESKMIKRGPYVKFS